MCGASFDRTTVKGFTCPGCGEKLTYETETKFVYVWFVLCAYCFPVLLYCLGVRHLIALIGAPVALYSVGFRLSMWLIPLEVVQKYGGLRLTDRTKFRKNPTDWR
jgi:hypothetical protein